EGVADRARNDAGRAPNVTDATDGPAADASDGAAGPRPATLDDYWNGRARWSLLRSYTLANTGWPYGYGAGAHITIVGGAWYLFGRFVEGPAPSYCQSLGTVALGTQVRKSTDKGVTWSAPVEIIPAAQGTPWECAATDGDAVYDAVADKW